MTQHYLWLAFAPAAKDKQSKEIIQLIWLIFDEMKNLCIGFALL